MTAIVVPLVWSCSDRHVREIPLEEFFRNSEVRSYDISPDGKYLSYMAPYESRMNIFVQQAGSDSSRIAIYGGSYGGYATLAGLTYTPDLYACGVDYVGVSNLFTFLQTIPPYWKPMLDMMYEMVGDPQKDSTMLAAYSPALNADKIKAPLLVVQGANDPRVNKAESDQMVAALRARGVDVDYMVKDNEGHGFHNEENRFAFYRTMERFLAKHLKGEQIDAVIEEEAPAPAEADSMAR